MYGESEAAYASGCKIQKVENTPSFNAEKCGVVLKSGHMNWLPIRRRIKNESFYPSIYKNGELTEAETVAKNAIVQIEGRDHDHSPLSSGNAHYSRYVLAQS